MTRASNAEVLLISSILRTEDMGTVAKQAMTADMFFGYADEYTWIERYYLRHRKVPSKLAFKSQFPGFTIKAVDDTGYFCEQVKQSFIKRTMTMEMRSWAQLLTEGDVEAAVSAMHTAALTAASSIGVYNDSNIFDDDSDIMEELDSTIARVKDNGTAGIPLGWDTYDSRTGGAKPGELITVAGRLGEGKSWGLTKWAVSASIAGHACQYNSLEMSRSQLAYRAYSLLAEEGQALFSNTDLMKGMGFNPTDFKAFLVRLKKKMQGQLHISDRSRGQVTPLTIAAQIERIHPEIVFIDYITLMGTNGPKNWSSIGEVTGELKGLAMTHKIPIVIAAQLNRERGIVAKKWDPPGAEALSQSDMIGHDSDTIITLTQPTPRVQVFKCVKNRYGQGGFKWYTHFDPAKGIYKEITYDRALEIRDEDDEQAEGGGK